MNINHNDSKEDIKKYTTPNGAVRYKFTIYLGKDELTGNTNQIRKQGFKSYDEALKKYDFYQKKLKQGIYTGLEGKKHKFQEIYEMWLKVYKPTVKESTSFKTMRFFENHILNEIGNFYIENINVIKAQQLVTSWFAKNEYSTACTMFTKSKRVFSYANKVLDLIEINPFDRVITPTKKKERKEFTDYYTIDELNHFLECARKKRFKWYVAFEILAHTGMRVGELLALNWSDVNFDENATIRINKTTAVGEHNRALITSPKTYNSYRIIEIDDKLKRVLQEWRQKQRKLLFMRGENPLSDNQLILSNRKNEPLRINVVNYWNRTLCEKNNLRHIKIHGFRHTFASIAFENGAKPEEVKKQLGHKSITTTLDIYTHVTKEQQRKVVKQFADIIEL